MPIARERWLLWAGVVCSAVGAIWLGIVPHSRGAAPQGEPLPQEAPLPLEILTGGLPSAATGVMYEVAFEAEGGSLPYTWSLSGGNLPPGMFVSQDGIIRGTPSAPGMFTFQASVTDSSGPPSILSAVYVLEVINSNFAGNVLWSSDFETADITQWYAPSLGAYGVYGGAQFNSGSGYARPTRQRSHTGQWGLEMTVSTPPMSATRMFRWRESSAYQSLYYSAWYYFPQHYTIARYWNVFQWKSKISRDQNDPFFILNVGNRLNGNMYFYLYNWQRKQSYRQSWKDIPVGQWLKIDGYYACSGISAGRVTIWQDGALLFDITHVPTRYVNGDCQWAVDNYSDNVSPSPSTFFIDDAAITTKLPWASGE